MERVREFVGIMLKEVESAFVTNKKVKEQGNEGWRLIE